MTITYNIRYRERFAKDERSGGEKVAHHQLGLVHPDHLKHSLPPVRQADKAIGRPPNLHLITNREVSGHDAFGRKESGTLPCPLLPPLAECHKVGHPDILCQNIQCGPMRGACSSLTYCQMRFSVDAEMGVLLSVSNRSDRPSKSFVAHNRRPNLFSTSDFSS